MLARAEMAGGAGLRLLLRDLAKDSEEIRGEESQGQGQGRGLPLDALLLPRDELLPILSGGAESFLARRPCG